MTAAKTCKTVCITGGTSGIGLAIAKMFLKEGDQVLLCDLPTDQAKQIALELKVKLFTADLSNQREVLALCAQLQKEQKTIDILINNAGFQHIAPVEDFPIEKWNSMIQLMLTTPYLLAKQAIPGMKQKQWGRIINIASIHGVVASPFKSAYISAKHGLLGFTKTLALELGAHNITANAICPAYVETPLVTNQIKQQAATRGVSENEVISDIMLKPAAIKRLIQPEEIAAMVRLLCTDEGASITGSPLMMDSGWTSQ